MSKTKMTKEEYTNLLTAERKIADVLPDIDNLENCGVECQELRTLLQQRQQQITQVKRHFAPNGLL